MTKKRNDGHLVNEQVLILCRALKMPGLARSLDDIIRRAQAEAWSALDVIEEALSAELASREASAAELRLREARFLDVLTLDTFDFAGEHGIDKTKMLTLGRGSFIDDKQNVVFIGPVGTGKTHLATALGVEATKRRQRVLFTRAADLVRNLIEAKGDRELGRLERKLARAKVLVLDELGFVPFDREGGELLFNLLSARHRSSSTIITSNLPFSEWPKVFGGDEKLTSALLDRLAENAVVITTKGKSYRARKRKRPS